MIEINQLEKYFGDKHVLKNINLLIETGEVVAIIGPSGSGKSTLLRCLNLLESPNSGHITVNDRQVDTSKISRKEAYSLRQETAMVFQHYNLFRNKTALQNVTESLIANKKMKKSEANARGLELLQRVGLADQAQQYPITLSGGQQQRVSIARALAVHPYALLFDEPTSALDPELVNEVLQVIRELATQSMTMVIVTHEMQFAREVADRIIFMEDGELIVEGTPDEVFADSSNPRLRQFLSQVHTTPQV
ncbi:amino acid ABC transporter ATP-binding protein [Enterococcus italicus]|uniref:ABC transporter, ATP-binding protein n=1 Tax=Enterococcus italicus (strain DSM 15952 / CCUG 50447 / LMG 22039 / TP 1.5) TaxID=888064 RepID=E6LDH1_ENTI1|nr:amino acid ABC transporter ATP-binding protein [Enterococcus italicus]EFU74747.1 ABC transporter, ATP-binding protein [Enterococcus italicus DSM 15952]OJG60719.1 arginine ABC transporter ATP-binding protein [Enterococcus italicus DSM 15952]HCS29899.1 amino acid ABC transporter ATP-binding protein [Enterococcus sp.]